MAKRLTGLNPLAYMGVEPLAPSNTVTARSNPNVNDFQGFNVGDTWINISTQQIWVFVGLNTMRQAQWVETGAPAGVGASDFITDSGTAIATGLGFISVVGGSNINTDGNTPNTVTINLNDSVSITGSMNVDSLNVNTGPTVLNAGDLDINGGNINLPRTFAIPEGVITVGGANFIHSFGDNPSSNAFLGRNAGNLTLTVGSAVANNGFGGLALNALTTGAHNIAIGTSAGSLLTTGDQNTFIGGALSIITGDRNVTIGSFAGNNYTGAESSNIVISNLGVIGDTGIIRIGASPEQAKCFIAGISGVTTDINDAVPVLVDSAGQLGVTSSSRVYKDNIVSMRDDSLGLMALRPVTFEYKTDVRKMKQYGFIAEEVAEVMPDLVVYNQEGKPETVKYHVMPAIIINELQRLNERINELQSHCSCRRAD